MAQGKVGQSFRDPTFPIVLSTLSGMLTAMSKNTTPRPGRVAHAGAGQQRLDSITELEGAPGEQIRVQVRIATLSRHIPWNGI